MEAIMDKLVAWPFGPEHQSANGIVFGLLVLSFVGSIRYLFTEKD